MAEEVYTYSFADNIIMKNIEDTLLLSVIAAEAIHGRSRVNLDAEFQLNEKRRNCEVDASTPVGRDIARIFTGLLTSEIGESAFKVSRRNKEVRRDEH